MPVHGSYARIRVQVIKVGNTRTRLPTAGDDHAPVPSSTNSLRRPGVIMHLLFVEEAGPVAHVSRYSFAPFFRFRVHRGKPSVIRTGKDRPLRQAVTGCDSFPAPGFLQRLLRAVFRSQPVTELAAQQGSVGRRLLERSHQRPPEDIVLVLQLHESQRGVVGVPQAGIRVAMLEHIDS